MHVDSHKKEHSHSESFHEKKSGHEHMVLTIRAQSGLSGDMLLAGMAHMSACTQAELNALLALLDVPELLESVQLVPRSVNGIAGIACTVNVPHEHCHRTQADIARIVRQSRLNESAKTLALNTFALLAEAEAAVHGMAVENVCFHEVGALDSILDICLVCTLFVRLTEDTPCTLICSPLPLSDGGVYCAHGWLPTPAPAVLRLLEGVRVCSFAGMGETVTPTALALLKTLHAQFGEWPAMRIERTALVYGTKIFDNVPNGSVWALGQAD